MASKYNEPEGIVIDWIGPYRLDEAPDKCSAEQLGSAVYVAFGRHKSLPWWPLWFERRWVRKMGNSSQFRLSTRPTLFPLQYVGIGVDPCARADAEKHEHLSQLSPKHTYIWFAKPISRLDPSAITGNGHPTAVLALEKALIFCTKPRRNSAEYDISSAPILTAWCRQGNLTGVTRVAARLARRLVENLRFDPDGISTIEFSSAIPEKRVRFRLTNRRQFAHAKGARPDSDAHLQLEERIEELARS